MSTTKKTISVRVSSGLSLGELGRTQFLQDDLTNLISRGTPIDVDEPIVRRFNRKIKPGDPRAAFRFCDKIITSNLISDKLPITFDDPAKARELCKLTFKFSADDEKRFKRKNRHWWSFGAEYMRVEYEVRVKVGAADVTFELCEYCFLRRVLHVAYCSS